MLAACDTGSQRRFNQDELDLERRRREPRRIKESEIIEAGLQQGQSMVAFLQLNSQPPGSSCCPQVPPSLLDSLRNQHQANIMCYSLRDGKAAAKSRLEQELLEAYRYSAEQNMPLETNIQAEGNEYFIFTAPATNGAATKIPCAIWSIRLSRKEIVLNM
ncbi:hypothetical protein D770_14800 [Flammeovirgaceae bacterium 311]|nr:hypothetical protein D770_14800 [Flammeovirgaceae bacterium 311]